MQKARDAYSGSSSSSSSSSNDVEEEKEEKEEEGMLTTWRRDIMRTRRRRGGRIRRGPVAADSSLVHLVVIAVLVVVMAQASGSVSLPQASRWESTGACILVNLGGNGELHSVSTASGDISGPTRMPVRQPGPMISLPYRTWVRRQQS